MRFAIVDNKRVEAKTGLIGKCPGCSEPVIPKCGNQRVHHWAHNRNRMCDTWWEPETEWHRSWKSKFPEEWQENFLIDDKTGEKHIADIQTNKGLVIEFQHSHIDPKERLSREAFYKNLAWVVDGSRLKRDYTRFLKGKPFFKTMKKGIFTIDVPQNYFPSAWLESSVPVLFDFQNIDTLSDPENKRHVLCCLFPEKIHSSTVVAEMTQNGFVNDVMSGEWAVKTSRLINDITQLLRNQKRGEDFRRFLRYSVPRGRRF